MSPPLSNGIVETSLYVDSPPRAVEFYERVFGFRLIDMAREEVTEKTRLCPLQAGDRHVLLLFRKGGTEDTDASGSIHIAFAIAADDLNIWENWLGKQGIPIESRRTWKHGGQSLYFRDPNGHLLEVATPGVWSIY